MLDAKIIRPSQSPWSAPVVMQKKKDGSSRFCVDYRNLNNISIQDSFPLPRIDDILDRLAGSAVYTAIDLKSGYWKIPMHEDSIAQTVFSTPDGHYEFLDCHLDCVMRHQILAGQCTRYLVTCRIYKYTWMT